MTAFPISPDHRAQMLRLANEICVTADSVSPDAWERLRRVVRELRRLAAAGLPADAPVGQEAPCPRA